jgi:hypothetical protein
LPIPAPFTVDIDNDDDEATPIARPRRRDWLVILSIAQAIVNKDIQVDRPSDVADTVPCGLKICSLTASCNALPVASRSGRAKAGLHASSRVRSLIRKDGPVTVEGDRLGVEINQ